MDRNALLDQLEHEPGLWDIIVIGGGATGLGTAVEAASRGYRTLLLEQCDFGKGTSSRSTKLVHGGVRYLQQGNVGLVFDALRERGRLLENAPHLVQVLPFVVPCYSWWERPYYGIGLKLYEKLSGRLSLGPSRLLSVEETVRRMPNVSREGLRGGVLYYDGQFDDSRLTVSLAQTIAAHGSVPLNYMQVTSLRKQQGHVCGVVAQDVEGGRAYELSARVVVNATGVFTDEVRLMDEPGARRMIQASQGIHIVLDRTFLAGETAIMVPRTDDGRVLFAIPWHDRVVLGTTDTPIDDVELEPRAFEEEVAYLLEHSARYLDRAPAREDVLSVFAGLRPLVRTGDGRRTASLSRDHVLEVSSSGLVTITGGKWTTYRKMGEETVDEAIRIGGLEQQPSDTSGLRIHGWVAQPDPKQEYTVYGADAAAVRETVASIEGGNEPLHPRLPYCRGEVVWAIRHEMARTVDDVLARRTRALLLDAQASIEAAPGVAALIAQETGRDEAWCQDQVASFTDLASGYLLSARPQLTLAPSLA